ncbi:hypothetical protein ACWCPS_34670 [Streptomyces mauvecolor]
MALVYRGHLRRSPRPARHRPGPKPHPPRHAIERTVPFGLYCYTITVVWYALHGRHPSDAAEHRAGAPWYTTKTAPSVADMAAKLRRTVIASPFWPNRPGRPTDQEIRAVQHAWAAASPVTAAA